MIAINTAPREEEHEGFQPGDLVRHRRYGYRGVVVARTDSCQADDAWYFKNQPHL